MLTSCKQRITIEVAFTMSRTTGRLQRFYSVFHPLSSKVNRCLLRLWVVCWPARQLVPVGNDSDFQFTSVRLVSSPNLDPSSATPPAAYRRICETGAQRGQGASDFHLAMSKRMAMHK